MYFEDEHVHPPSNDVRIWRYMDFTKFVSLLSRSELFFSGLDLLGCEAIERCQRRLLVGAPRLHFM